MKPRPTPITEARVRELLDTYGSDPAHWPTQERVAGVAMLSGSIRLQHYQAQVAPLDRRLQEDRRMQIQNNGPTEALQMRILASLPAAPRRSRPGTMSWQDRLSWLLPTRAAFALVTVMLVAMTVYLHTPSTPETASDNPAFERWAWYDITDHELGGQPDTSRLSMLELLELEAREDEV